MTKSKSDPERGGIFGKLSGRLELMLKKALPNPGNILRNTKMQNKLVLSFLALTIIPLFVSGVFSVNNSNDAIKGKISTYSQQLVNQVSLNINTSLLKVKNYSDDIIISPEINNQLTGYKTAGDADKAALRLNFSRIMQLKFLNTDNVDDALLTITHNGSEKYDVVHVGAQFNWEAEDLHRLMDLNNQKENTGNFTLSLVDFGGGDGKDIVIGRKIGSELTSGTLGHLFIALNQDYLGNIYKDIDIGKGSGIFIMDTDGVVMSSNDPRIVIGKSFSESKLAERIRQAGNAEGNTFSVKIGKEDMLVAYSKIKDANWYIVSTIPYSYLNSEAAKLSYRIILLILIFLILAIGFSFIFSWNISAPLKKLERNMAEFGEGGMGKRIEVDREDEIGHLQKSFNAMAEDIGKLLAKIDEENILRRKTELKVLEYQINPHFLYNSLDSINWMAQKAGQSDIGLLAAALAKFFRLGLSKGNETYTIRDEMEHVHNYLIISKIRYKDCFEFTMDIEPSILECKTIKIIMQPLVENAIKHGINKSGNSGIIRIAGRKDDDRVILTVSDNGKGMEMEQVDYFNRAFAEKYDAPANEKGFGLLNVNQRIRLNYGDKYGVFLDSPPGGGVSVQVTLPAVK